MNIGIIGLGFVGLSFAAVLGSKKIPVIGMDTNQDKLKKIYNSKSPFYEPDIDKFLKNALSKTLRLTDNFTNVVSNSDIIFLTVGTPKSKSGYIDLSMLKNASKSIGIAIKKLKKTPIIVVKSTVVPGTAVDVVIPTIEKFSSKKHGKNFHVLSNPEFLKEGSAINDTLNPHLIVIGGLNSKPVTKLSNFYKKLYGEKIKIMKTNSQTAEMIKYANNSFLATKISFINQISALCQSIPGTNVDEIAEAIGYDPRIGNLFLKAGPGYGGSCLPKDLSTLIHYSSKIGNDPSLLKAVQKTNNIQIHQIMKILKKNLVTLKNKNITILGLSFKENSDDIRESRSIELIKILLKNGCKVTAHDPKSIENTKLIFDKKINYSNSITNSLKNSDCAIIMTAWENYKKLTNHSFTNMNKKFIIDSRRILTQKNLDVNYIGLGLGNN
tara:strand:- start:1834 stop:3150 length:1317 start_codon:yes stop_codon:yes gene_type:complete